MKKLSMKKLSMKNLRIADEYGRMYRRERDKASVQYRVLIAYIKSKVNLSKFRSQLNYHTCFSLYIFSIVFFGWLFVCFEDGFSATDGLLLAVSAVCSTGLSPVPMTQISKPSFAVLAVMMFVSNPIALSIPPLIARRYFHRKVMRKITAADSDVLNEYKLIYDGTGVFLVVAFVYFALCHIAFISLLYISLFLHPHDPELESRGIGRFATAVFTGISGFSNGGYALSSTQLFYYQNNPFFYTVLSILILAGNTAAPVLLRLLLSAVYKLCLTLTQSNERMHIYINIAAIKYVLDNPRRITTVLFDAAETRFLGWTVLLINVVQYVFYLASTLPRKEAETVGGPLRLAAIGVFQTISTRNAGFQIMDLRGVNQGMLVVYALAMYLSTAPFLSTMYLTQKDGEESSGKCDPEFSDSSSGDSDADTHEVEVKAAQGSASDRRGSIKSMNEQIKENFIFKHNYYLLMALCLLAFTEDTILSNHPEDFNLWYILFEVSSAYGGVGLSMGIPGKSFSLCGAFTVTGKIVICAVQLLGKHRGMPSKTDSVIDFKFSRLIQASRRRAVHSAKLRMPSNILAGIRETVDMAGKRLSSISPRVSTKAIDPGTPPGIAILELKRSEKKRRHSASDLSVSDKFEITLPKKGSGAVVPLTEEDSQQSKMSLWIDK